VWGSIAPLARTLHSEEPRTHQGRALRAGASQVALLSQTSASLAPSVQERTGGRRQELCNPV
jgi:hypothetical protein